MFRPTSSANVIDFAIAKGMSRLLWRAGCPLDRPRGVHRRTGEPDLPDPWPMVGQAAWAETAAASRRPTDNIWRSVRSQPSCTATNLPLPTKVVTEVLAPIDIVETLGQNPDLSEVDAHIRDVMHGRLD